MLRFVRFYVFGRVFFEKTYKRVSFAYLREHCARFFVFRRDKPAYRSEISVQVGNCKGGVEIVGHIFVEFVVYTGVVAVDFNSRFQRRIVYLVKFV